MRGTDSEDAGVFDSPGESEDGGLRYSISVKKIMAADLDDKGKVVARSLFDLADIHAEIKSALETKHRDAKAGMAEVGTPTSGLSDQNVHNINMVLAENNSLRERLLKIQADSISKGVHVDFVTKDGYLIASPIEMKEMDPKTRADAIKRGANNRKTQESIKMWAFWRGLTQSYVDGLSPSAFENFRKSLIKVTEDAYEGNKGNRLGGFPKILPAKGVTLGTVASEGLVGIQTPLKKADKTWGALSLNSLCPMFTVGNSGCWLDGCYLTQMGNSASGTNLFKSAIYTGEILQISDQEIKNQNKTGGLRFNGVGDTTDNALLQWADAIRHANMRGLKIKIITKQIATFEHLEKIRKMGVSIDGVIVQPSLDNLWSPAALDDFRLQNVRGGMQPTNAISETVAAGRFDPAAVAYEELYGRETKVVDGVMYRKYGFSEEQLADMAKRFPEIKIIPRYVVANAAEIAELALRKEDAILTLMHGKVEEGMVSDYPGRLINFEAYRHLITKDKDGWHFYGVTNKKKIRSQTRAHKEVEDYIKANYSPEDQDTIFRNMQRRMCCQDGTSIDACMDCAAHGAICSNRIVAMNAGEEDIAGQKAVDKNIGGPEYRPVETALRQHYSMRYGAESFGGEVNFHPAFMSPLANWLVDNGTVKTTPTQWVKRISSAPFKSEHEFEFLGIKDWIMEQKESLTGEDILAYYFEVNDLFTEVNEEQRWRNYSPSEEFRDMESDSTGETFYPGMRNYRMLSVQMNNLNTPSFTNSDMRMHNKGESVMMFTRVEDILPESKEDGVGLKGYPHGVTYGIEVQSDAHSEAQKPGSAGYVSFRGDPRHVGALREAVEKAKAEHEAHMQRLSETTDKLYDVGVRADELLSSERERWSETLVDEMTALREKGITPTRTTLSEKGRLLDAVLGALKDVDALRSAADRFDLTENPSLVEDLWDLHRTIQDLEGVANDVYISRARDIVYDAARFAREYVDANAGIDRTRDALVMAEGKANVTPDLPFKKDYPLLGFKMWLRDAIIHAHDAVMWSGWTHANRWQIPENFASVEVTKREKNLKYRLKKEYEGMSERQLDEALKKLMPGSTAIERRVDGHKYTYELDPDAGEHIGVRVTGRIQSGRRYVVDKTMDFYTGNAENAKYQLGEWMGEKVLNAKRETSCMASSRHRERFYPEDLRRDASVHGQQIHQALGRESGVQEGRRLARSALGC